MHHLAAVAKLNDSRGLTDVGCVSAPEFPRSWARGSINHTVRIFSCPSLFPAVRNETYGRHWRRKCIRHDGGFLYAAYNYLTSKQVLSNLEVRRQIYFLPSVSRNHKFNLHLLPDMLRKLNTCFSYGGGRGGIEVWKNDFSAISWRSHLPQILGGVFCQGKDKGWRGRAARAVIKK